MGKPYSDGWGDDEDPPLAQLASLLVLGLGLTALFMGYSWFWVVFVVGFAVVVPIAKLLSQEFGVGTETRSDDRSHAYGDSETRATAPESKTDALDSLRDRYARGELSDEQFEQKVEKLLETETPESAREYTEREKERA
ncbi:SHOCT domain-containing protein [Halorussus halophilus]|uniref:SHOCT domain-containing protein n=1 Tax=Halorussus halophilus TaxID=2650975 RepID=UPI00130135AB|nr:SHOCT domain-containing protein [Halorussus halophilus]